MAFFKFLFLSIIVISPAFAEFGCFNRAHEANLYFQRADGVEFELVEFQFPEIGFVPPVLNCMSLLDQLKNNFSIQGKMKDQDLHEVLTFSSKRAARLTGKVRSEIYGQCRRSGGCSLRFPFSLLTDEPEYVLTKDLKKESPQCFEYKPLDREAPQIDSVEKTFSQVSFFDISEKPITTEIEQRLREHDWDKVYLSSMTMSASFIKNIIAIARTKKTEIHLIFSFTLQSLLREFPDYFYSLPPNVLIHPIYPGPAREGSYHVKGALFLGKESHFIFFTGNFRNYDEEKFSDIALDAKLSHPNLIEEHFKRQIWYGCEGNHFASCSLATRFEIAPPSQGLLNHLGDISCQNIQRPRSNPLARNARNTDMKSFFLAEARKATKSIDIAVHQFNDKELLNLLKELGRKIQVRVFIGSPQALPSLSAPFLKLNKSSTNYHSKFIIIDGKKIIWMTGNLTRSSYQNPWESAFEMEREDIVREFIGRFEATYEKN